MKTQKQDKGKCHQKKEIEITEWKIERMKLYRKYDEMQKMKEKKTQNSNKLGQCKEKTCRKCVKKKKADEQIN